jgi:polysaccharide biosynthesis/export protein
MNKFLYNFLLIALLSIFFSSCRSLNPNRMFQTDRNYMVDSIQKQVAQAEKNYFIQKNDYISLQVFSNGGERIIDPDWELTRNHQVINRVEPPRYLIKTDGYVRLPMVGDVFLHGLTLYQADTLLSNRYSKYYQSPFVITKLLNKRAVVLGPTGGKVIPLENENINLIELLAIYGGIADNGKAYNLRLIRGDLKDPNVTIIDLSTIEGMRKASLDIQPNDIVYIETRRRLISESLAEIAPLISILNTILVTVILITR